MLIAPAPALRCIPTFRSGLRRDLKSDYPTYESWRSKSPLRRSLGYWCCAIFTTEASKESHREGMAFFLYGLATLLLLFRFAKKKPANLDRIALTAYVFCWLPAGGPEFSLWLAAGLLMRVLSWAVYRWRTGPASI
jgi:hypothetical protein